MTANDYVYDCCLWCCFLKYVGLLVPHIHQLCVNRARETSRHTHTWAHVLNWHAPNRYCTVWQILIPRLGLLIVSWPDGSAEWWKEWTRWDILRLPLGPVVASKRPSQGALLQGQAEVNEPEEEQQVGQLQQEEVAVVGRLPAVEGEQTLRGHTWRWFGDVASAEGLTETWEQRELIYCVFQFICVILIWRKNIVPQGCKCC